MSQFYKVIGLMSGTSLDGLDMAYCTFEKESRWKFSIDACDTLSYPQKLRERLSEATDLNAEELLELDLELGDYWGKAVKSFISSHQLEPDFISSHGHTIFHQPEKGITMQIGSGQVLNSICGFPVINDFRSQDVKLGGEGAPLVPIGDKELFADYDVCINLGGIANLSYQEIDQRLAYDICACNMVLNFVSNKLGFDFDENGNMASTGTILPDLLDQLDSFRYYAKSPPKSLGFEDIEKHMLPLLGIAEPRNELRTLVEHIALQVSRSVGNIISNQTSSQARALVTGGGAFNTFLVGRISDLVGAELVIPDEKIITYKEALVFALLGVLKVRGEVNVLRTVTGASADSCSGTLIGSLSK